jgi:hypothetical protein
MTRTTSWAWMGQGTFPGFTAGAQNPISSGANGLSVSPSGYRDITWIDGDHDGLIRDADSGDGSGAGTDRVMIGGVEKTVQDIGAFEGSTMVVNGVPQAVLVGVWVFTDGTYMVRINDADIPDGVHHDAVDSLRLGSWNGTEYNGSYVSTRDEGFICFAAGTLIHTEAGQVAVERLQVGQRVMTADHGFRPLRWIGRRTVGGTGDMAPVLITRGALGNVRPLRVSPLHRMLIGGWRAELMFASSELLVPAISLVNDSTIRRAPCRSVTYVHFLCDRHEIVFAEGIPTESLHPGSVALSRLDQAARDEILTLFPALAHNPAALGPAARAVLPGWGAALLT